jgi:2-keto-4-pentenoate hydratase/2-oxohepta-3-ene-1,7-dioic acid hydratase in catechol pathway
MKPDRRHPPDHAGQWRDAAGRPHRTIDLRLPLPHQLSLDLHHAGARRRHRDGNADGAGARFDPPRYLKPGDVIEVEAEGVGVLKNGVADEA